MEYKRLTERVGKGVAIKETSRNDNMSIWNAIERLAELEDKIEQGTLKEEKTCVYQEYNDGDWSYWECSNCEEPFCFNNECTPEENQYHYCPNCGARITEYKEMQE
jgi:DNA-directed RNA polymerase subunit RPC12/RpoP